MGLHQAGVFEVRQFTGVIEIYIRPPRLPWQQKFGNFGTKLARTRLIQELEPRTLHQTGGFSGQAI